MYTVDTNILIYHANGDPKVSGFLIAQTEAGAALLLPTIAVVEFFAFPALTTEAQEAFESLLPFFRIVSLDYHLALAAADLRRTHRLKLGDSIIAATALSTKSSLATRNIRDFKKIPNLEVMKI